MPASEDALLACAVPAPYDASRCSVAQVRTYLEGYLLGKADYSWLERHHPAFRDYLASAARLRLVRMQVLQSASDCFWEILSASECF